MSDAERKKDSTVGFQGERGSYSEEAARRLLGGDVTSQGYRSLADLFEVLENDRIDRAIVPIENSLEGSVNEAYDLLLRSSMQVTGEINIRIRHCLIAHQGVKKDTIKTVYSHPQALAQCKNFLRKLGRETVPSYDTAGSVKMVKERRLLDAAAIASKDAASVYGMQVVEEGIEDEETNFTRFFLLSKKESPPTGRDKTSIIFSAPHVPGSLFRALEEFANRGINLTKIESRPTRLRPWEYNFYLDFEGHRDDEMCREALDALTKRSKFLKILGSYPKAKENV